MELSTKIETGLDLDADVISGLISYCEMAPPLDAKEYFDNIVGQDACKDIVQQYLKLRGYVNVSLIATGNLVRSRRAVLINWKWVCLEGLLSLPKQMLEKQVLKSDNVAFFDITLRYIFDDLVDSLENAGEASALPILTPVRLNVELFASRTGNLTVEMMWNLVKSSWILHVSFNKRRVAPTANLLSFVLHYSVFGDLSMHEYDDEHGLLKWKRSYYRRSKQKSRRRKRK